MLYYAIPSFALGIYFLQQQASLANTPIFIGIAAASLTLLLLTTLFKKCALTRKYPGLTFDKYVSYGHTSLVCLCMFACGFAWAAWRADLRLQDRLCPADEMHPYTIQGKISNLPRLIAGFNAQPGWRFIFTPISSQTSNSKCQLPSNLLLNWYNPPEIYLESPIQAGERWQFMVTLKRPHGLANPGGNDYEAWLLQHHIGATGRISYGKRLQTTPSFSFSDFINQQRATLLTHIQTLLGKEAAHLGVLQALAVGEQHAIHEQDWATFRATGTSHLLAISGLHITLVAGIVACLGSWCWRRSKRLPLYLPAPHFGMILGMVAAFIYSLLAGFQIPARRAFIMLLVAAIAHLSGRLPASLLVLSWALFFVLLFDPWAVLSAGFWLSFIAVATILWVLRKPAHQLNLSQPFAYPRTFKQRLAHTWSQTFQKLRQGSHIQLAVSTALIPLTALFFGQIAILSPLANAFAIPIFSFLVTPLTLISLFTPNWLAAYLLIGAHQIVAWTTQLLDMIGKWPYANLHVSAAIAWACAFSILGLSIFLYGKNRWRWLSLLFFGCSGFCAIWLPSRSQAAQGEFRATVFDVGQGGATLIRTAHHALLYDTGPAPAKNSLHSTAKHTILPYLRQHGIRGLDALIISHQDLDHSGGLSALLLDLTIHKISSSIDKHHVLLDQINSKAIPHYRCEAGQSWEWDGVRFTFIHPLVDTAGKPNALSCALHISNAHHALLLPGDIGRKQEQEIVLRTRPEILSANVLVMPHHGSKTSSSSLWIEAINPQLAIAQVGYHNRFHHPHLEVLNRYEAQGVTIQRSDYDGAIEITTEGHQLNWQSWRDQHRRYWHWYEDKIY